MVDFGEWYREKIQKLGNQRVHIDVGWANPEDVLIGEYVMYLPIEITEGADLPPRVAKVTRKDRMGDDIHITTEEGMMIFRPGDTIQVIL